jgi:dTDP-4-dehydrorhamnose 3,5-epimerase
MNVQTTSLPGVILLTRNIYKDGRGYFYEDYRANEYHQFPPFVQDNLSSSRMGVVRGLHYQLMHPQAKLVTCFAGRIQDVVVDIRKGSPTFGQHVKVDLAGDTGDQLFVPVGFAHGFVVMSSSALVHYKCSDYYDPQGMRGILWNDPALAIPWDIPRWLKVALSERDARNPLLKDAELP